MLHTRPPVPILACATLALLAASEPRRESLRALMARNVVAHVAPLLSADPPIAVAGLRLLSALALCGPDAPPAMSKAGLVAHALRLFETSNPPPLVAAAVRFVGDAAVDDAIRRHVLSLTAPIQNLKSFAAQEGEVAASARRTLALLGLYRPPKFAQGVRILCIDGGGVKGIVALQILRVAPPPPPLKLIRQELETRLGAPLSAHFDLVGGTSAGSMVAAGLALGLPLEEIVALFHETSAAAFSARSVSQLRPLRPLSPSPPPPFSLSEKERGAVLPSDPARH
jgi:hypothetical protein